MSFLRNIESKYYPFLEVIKAVTLILFSYGILYHLENKFNAPIFPRCFLEALFLLSFSIFLFLSWLLGERKKTLLVFAYFVTFQIIGLAVILKDPWVIPRVLIPTLLTYLTLFLFKSPEEFEKERQLREMKILRKKVERLKGQLASYREQLEEFEQRYRFLEEEKRKLEKVYNSTHSEELKKLLDQKERELLLARQRVEELTRKIENLKENNKELWQLLEESLEDEEQPKGLREEVRELRRERKKLMKRLRELEKLVEDLKREKRAIEIEREKIEEELKGLEESFETLKEIANEKERRLKEVEKLLNKSIVSYLNLLLERVIFTPRALADFESLSETVKENFLKYLKKLDRMEPSSAKFESLGSPNRIIFKDRFSGGRVYFTVKNGKFVIEGVLEGEDEKTKARFIKERFS